MVNGTIGGGITSPQHETLIATQISHSSFMLLANHQCQLVLLLFMQLALVPISLVATPIYVLLATATCSCQLVMLRILSQVASHSLAGWWYGQY